MANIYWKNLVQLDQLDKREAVVRNQVDEEENNAA